MRSEGPFRGLSLDLWFTSFFHGPEDPATWESARLRVLARYLALPSGRPCRPEELATASRAVLGTVRLSGPVTTPPEQIVAAIARRLDAVVQGGLGEAGLAYSAAGLAECPPRPNPEAVTVVDELAARGIPTVLVTNSARASATWREFLAAPGRPRFRDVVSSADFGSAKPDPEILLEAARRLRLPPEKLLHVGDRRDLDVTAAIAAGCGAALYRGLWDRYPDDLATEEAEPSPEHAGVPVLDRLEALLDPRLWEPQDRPAADR